jgi:hypothetical protein
LKSPAPQHLTFSGTSKLTSVDMGCSPSRTTGADSLLLALSSPGRRTTFTQGEDAGSSASLLPALNTVRVAWQQQQQQQQLDQCHELVAAMARQAAACMPLLLAGMQHTCQQESEVAVGASTAQCLAALLCLTAALVIYKKVFAICACNVISLLCKTAAACVVGELAQQMQGLSLSQASCIFTRVCLAPDDIEYCIQCTACSQPAAALQIRL